jgi:hypothetical protein
MTKKIILLALCSLLLAPCSAADAQQRGKFLGLHGLTGSSPRKLQGLRDLGYVEGELLSIGRQRCLNGARSGRRAGPSR